MSEEEEVVWPVFAQHERLDYPEIANSLLDHVRIRSRILQLEELVDVDMDPRVVGLLNELGEWLDTHIRLEERVLFPLIEATLPSEVLHALTGKLSTNEPTLVNRVPWVPTDSSL